jgi:conflict system STAND superfamily ATPase/WD40 domain-containing protein
VRHRLLAVTGEMVGAIHPAVLAHWPRLNSWRAQDAVERDVRTSLTRAATAWADGGRRPQLLFRGARLAAALDWAAEHTGEMAPEVPAFLGASQRILLSEETRRRRRVVRLHKWLAATVAALVLAVAGGVWAMVDQRAARAASLHADAQRLAAQALIEPDLRRAVLLAVAASRLDPSVTDAAIRATLLRSPDLVAAAGEGTTAVAVSPDGASVVAGSGSGTVTVFRADTLATQARLPYPGSGPVNGVTFTPDGRQVVAWGGSRTSAAGQQATSIAVWSVASGQPDGPAFGEVWPDTGGGLLADGDTLLLAQRGVAGGIAAGGGEAGGGAVGGGVAGGAGDTAPASPMAWSLRARTPSTAYPIPSAPVTGLAVSLTGRFVALGTAAGTTVIEPAQARTWQLPGVRRASSLSPDGRLLLTLDGSDVVMWDVESGLRLGYARRHAGDVATTAWSADGKSFASAGMDGLVVVWDVKSLHPTMMLTGDRAPVRLVRFAHDGRTLYTADDPGTLLAWDLTGSARGLGARVKATTGKLALLALACTVAGRDMTRQEWSQYLPARPYRHLC